MLQFLRIQNFALLDSIELEFENGFSAMTGETGAGKSILLGALGLLSGARAEKTVIRQGADVCEVEGGIFLPNSKNMAEALEEMGLPACEDGLLVLKRIIHREKAPRIFINGSLATAGNLQQLGELWIDFHGPGEPRRLLKADCQIELLDLYGQLAPEAAVYRTEFENWKNVLSEIDRVSNETRLDQDQLDFMRQQIAKIDSIDLDGEAIEALERDFNRMEKSQELAGLAGSLASGLSGDEGVLNSLAPLVRLGRELAEIDPSMQSFVDRLESLAVEVEDLGGEFESFGGNLDFDSDNATDLQTRMAVLLELKRKYGREAVSIIEARAEMAARVDGQADIEGTLSRLEKQAAALERKCHTLAASLRQSREKAGKQLVKKAGDLLTELGFKKASLQVHFQPEKELRPFGDARPEFLFSPNVGEAPLPLARIASSGELARVMLALKTVLAEVDEIPVLVFDEVDANVGGEVGRVVGEKMAAIAKRHQVLCVTHLPQVASLGAQHFVVEKDQDGARAVVRIRAVHHERKERVGELARMLGDRSAQSARAHAEELLAR